MRPVLLSIFLALAGCAGDYSAPREDSAAAAPLVVPLRTDSGDRREPVARLAAAESWNAGALLAARDLGCRRAVWQLPGETFVQAAAVYAHGYVKGDCLILLPHSRSDLREWGVVKGHPLNQGVDWGTTPEYFLGYAGQFDGCECGPLVPAWPGVPVYYLSDDLHGVKL